MLIMLTLCLSKSFSQTIPDLSKYKTTAEKLEALADLCDELAITEDLKREEAVSRYALKLAPVNDWYYRSIFFYNLGYVFEAVTADSSIHYHELSLREARNGKNSKRIRMALERLLYSYNNTPGYKQKGSHI
jgi:hypothetical protein